MFHGDFSWRIFLGSSIAKARIEFPRWGSTIVGWWSKVLSTQSSGNSCRVASWRSHVGRRTSTVSPQLSFHQPSPKHRRTHLEELQGKYSRKKKKNNGTKQFYHKPTWKLNFLTSNLAKTFHTSSFSHHFPKFSHETPRSPSVSTLLLRFAGMRGKRPASP